MIEIIRNRLRSYSVGNLLEEEQATKEIIQEITLYGLWRASFFEIAAFQGGTCLRILHKLPRFSEDLDFILKMPDRSFAWVSWLRHLEVVLEEFGLHTEVIDKSNMDRAVREAILKDDAISKQLNLSFYGDADRRPLKIKLEIDTNPPAGSSFARSFLDFPLDFSVCHQDLPSNFALKIHALLARRYVKGRDWYDFGWYVKQRVLPNLALLEAALYQYGPWKGERLDVDLAWLRAALMDKIVAIDWPDAAQDVERFLGAAERQSLALWGEPFFRSKVALLA